MGDYQAPGMLDKMFEIFGWAIVGIGIGVLVACAILSLLQLFSGVQISIGGHILNFLK